MGSVALEGFGGGGGASLNFKVVPGLTQPGTAAENTIWVKTEKINDWYFSPTQPEGLQDWDVWFITSTKSPVEFNALKKNGVQICPTSAQQYVNGVLEIVPPMIYQNGRWTPWIVYLYDAGNEYESVTGGWTINGYGQKEDSRIFLGKNANYEKKDNTATTSNKLIFGGGEIVEVHGFFYSSTSASYFEVRLVDDSGTVVAKGEHTYADGNNVEVILTVTAPNGGGEFYVQVAAGQTTGDRSTYAYFNFARY